MFFSIMDGEREVSVVESKVRLEIENHLNQRITVERSVTGDTTERQLIRGLLGPALSEPGEYQRRDFYVRTGGAFQAESGFHRYLAEFIGYRLQSRRPDRGVDPALPRGACFLLAVVESLFSWRGKARSSISRIPDGNEAQVHP